MKTERERTKEREKATTKRIVTPLKYEQEAQSKRDSTRFLIVLFRKK